MWQHGPMTDTSPWAAPGGPSQPTNPATPFSPSAPPPPFGAPTPASAPVPPPPLGTPLPPPPSQPLPPPPGQPLPPPLPPGAMPPPNPYAYAPPTAAAGGQPTPGWTPPPKPGLIPLRPLTLGTLLGASFQVMRRNPRPTFGFALLLAGVISVISVLGLGIAGAALFNRPFQGGTSDDQLTLLAGGVVGGLVLGLLVPGALSLIGFSILQGIISLEVARGTVGEKLKLGGLWRAAKGRIAVLVGWSVLIIAAVTAFFVVVILLVAAGSVGLAGTLNSNDVGGAVGVLIAITLLIYLGFFVLAAWLGTKTALVPSILIIERLTLGKAIARSWRLTRKSFWRTFGILALVFVIIYFATSIITAPVQLLFTIFGGVLNPTGGTTESMTGTVVALAAVLTVVTVIVSAIGLIVQSAATALIYIDLRMRKEGLDLELARFVEARQAGNTSVPDPYLPRTPGATAQGVGAYGSGSAAPPAVGTSPWS